MIDEKFIRRCRSKVSSLSSAWVTLIKYKDDLDGPCYHDSPARLEFIAQAEHLSKLLESLLKETPDDHQP